MKSLSKRYFERYFSLLIVIPIFITQAVFSLIHSKGYYTYSDFFGYLSKDFSIFIFFMILLVTTFMFLYIHAKQNYLGNNLMSPLLLSLIALLSIYVLPTISDAYYDQDFYDAGAHMMRGAYVTLIGHSDPRIDAYFDLQPGFFWVTGILINVIFGYPTSAQSPAFLFLIKWFHVIALSTYLPILMVFFKRMKLDPVWSLLAFFLFLSLNIGRFHYAAQNYGNALYWLLLILLLNYQERTGYLILISITIVSASVVVVHQGVAFFSLIAIFSILMMHLIMVKKNAGYIRRIALVFFTFSAIWFMYLGYLSNWTLSNFISVIHSVISRYLSEGVSAVIKKGVYRPYDPWNKIIIFKSVYMLSLITLSMIAQIIILRREKVLANKSILAIYLVTTPIIGAVASALGGAGYIERTVIMLLPITAASFAKMLKNLNKGMTALIIPMALIILIFMGTLSYFSGRNFQSIPTSEDATGTFLLAHLPNIAGLYLRQSVINIFTPLLTSTAFIQGTYYIFYSHDYIQTLYYYVGDETKLNNYLSNIVRNYTVIYMSPTTIIIYP
jgi:hypothetical protein